MNKPEDLIIFSILRTYFYYKEKRYFPSSVYAIVVQLLTITVWIFRGGLVAFMRSSRNGVYTSLGHGLMGNSRSSFELLFSSRPRDYRSYICLKRVLTREGLKKNPTFYSRTNVALWKPRLPLRTFIQLFMCFRD